MLAGRYYKWHMARQKVRWIKARIAEGRTVYLVTYTKATRITARTLPAVCAMGPGSGYVPGLYVKSGAHWVCADGCAIRAD